MSKIFVYLTGGVGNQMFQYATARALAERRGGKVVLDTWSGFVRDKQYKHRYTLEPFPIKARPAKFWERLPIWLYRLNSKLRKSPVGEQKVFGNSFLVEDEFRFLPEVYHTKIRGSFWLAGYWQSPKYFEEYRNMLSCELLPPTPANPIFSQLGAEIRKSEAVAVGIRLYEDSTNPAAHAREGKVKTPEDVNKAILKLRESLPGAKFYIFCTHRSALFEELDLPPDTKYILPSEGFEGTIENLWLLTQFKHHIFTNSSFYWWGAWLSRQNYADGGQIIFAADNFINIDGLSPDWKRF